MLTATSRACSACGRLLPEPPAPQVCNGCGSIAAPPIAEWPAGLRAFLILELARSLVEVGCRTEQAACERLLQSVTRGRFTTYAASGARRVMPFGASAADCYPPALAAFNAWVAKGKPTHLVAPVVAPVEGR